MSAEETVLVYCDEPGHGRRGRTHLVTLARSRPGADWVEKGTSPLRSARKRDEWLRAANGTVPPPPPMEARDGYRPPAVTYWLRDRPIPSMAPIGDLLSDHIRLDFGGGMAHSSIHNFLRWGAIEDADGTQRPARVGDLGVRAKIDVRCSLCGIPLVAPMERLQPLLDRLVAAGMHEIGASALQRHARA